MYIKQQYIFIIYARIKLIKISSLRYWEICSSTFGHMLVGRKAITQNWLNFKAPSG